MHLNLETMFYLWSDITRVIFPKGTEEGSLNHMKTEIEEVLEDIKKEKSRPVNFNISKDKAFEYADVFLCLFTSLSRSNLSFDEVKECMMAKMMKNGMHREWKDNGDGSYSHTSESRTPSITHFYIPNNSDAFRAMLDEKGIKWEAEGVYTGIEIFQNGTSIDVYSLGVEYERRKTAAMNKPQNY